MANYRDIIREASNFVIASQLNGQPVWGKADTSTKPDFSLYHGTTGIIIALLELHQMTGEARYLDLATNSGDALVAHLAAQESISINMATGAPGQIFALAILAQATAREDFAVAWRRLLERLHGAAHDLGKGIGWIEDMPFSDITGHSGDREIYDVSVGAAGGGLVMLYLHRNGLHRDALVWAKQIGERLLEVGEPVEGSGGAGIRWRMFADMPFAYTTPGFAHGSAGTGYFMAELYRATGDTRYLDAAIAGAHYVLSYADPMGAGKLVRHTEEAPEPVYYMGVCNGPAGTGKLFLALHDVTGDAAWLDEARALTEGLLHYGAPEKRSEGFWNNHSQCCGDAGIGEYALLMAQRTEEAQYYDLAKRCAAMIIANATRQGDCCHWPQAEHRARPDFVQHHIGLMQGAAGIASFLIHLETRLKGEPVKIPLPDWPQGEVA